MTIASVRIYYQPSDQALKLQLNRTHWGFATWFERRLKPIREQLRGPEAKGVNIVNFMLVDDPLHAWRIDQWAKRMNSFEYSCLYDLELLLPKPPLENIEILMPFVSELASRAPWPQVKSVAQALAVPLSANDRETILPFLQWPRAMI